MQDAAEFLDPYLEALVEELLALTSHYTLPRKPDPASSIEAEELGEETQPGEGEPDMEGRDYTVR